MIHKIHIACPGEDVLFPLSRQDQVLHALEQLFSSRTGAESAGEQLGVTAEEVAEHLGIWRSNSSADLNALTRQGLVKKVSGRPARFLPVAPVAGASKALGTRYPLGGNPRGAVEASTPPSGALNTLDGVGHSMKEAMELAKAALRYPPNGMNTLLLGETGVGKSTFAEQMYQYAMQTGLLSQGAPFVAFNCAEYAHNPQILLDHLFGHVRGAFTGANEDKIGLVESANHGVLFLDEVHRLPPEGQEMLFELLDHGAFRRVGEASRTRRVSLRLFAATTEPPESVLLATFRRRIPMTIQLPALRDWRLEDRIQLIRRLFHREAINLGCNIRVARSAWMRLLYARFPANIGGLENTVRLSCARVFAQRLSQNRTNSDTLRQGADLVITPQDLSMVGHEPSDLRFTEGLSDIDEVVFRKDESGFSSSPLSLHEVAYSELDKLAKTLRDLGFGPEEMGYILERQLLRRQLQEPAQPMLEELRHFVGDHFYECLQGAWAKVEPDLALKQPQAVFLRITMHLFGLSQDPAETSDRPARAVFAAASTDKKTRVISYKLLETFARASGLPVLNDQEVAVVAAMLQEDSHLQPDNIGLILIMRGHAIADALADTAMGVLGPLPLASVNVPLTEDWTTLKPQIQDALKRLSQKNLVLVCTDLVEVTQYVESDEVSKERPISTIFRPDVTDIVQAVLRLRNTRNPNKVPLPSHTLQTRKREVPPPQGEELEVLACCMTGRGTASSVRRLIESSLPADLKATVVIRPMEVNPTALAFEPAEVNPSPATGLPGITPSPPMALIDMELHPKPNRRVVAAVGSVDPKLPNVPFLSLEEILGPGGIQSLVGLIRFSVSLGQTDNRIGNGEPSEEPCNNQQEGLDRFQSYVSAMLERDLVYVNPRLVHEVSLEVLRRIRQFSQRDYPRELQARFVLHMGYVVERGVQGEAMKNPYVPLLQQGFPDVWQQLLKSWQPVQETFRLPPNANELAYLFEILFPDLTAAAIPGGEIR